MQPHQPTKQPSAVDRFFSFWLVSWVMVPFLLFLFLHYFVFSAYHVVGNSMVPTLQNSDYLIISKVGRTFALVQGKPYIPGRDQTVVFHYPKQPELDFVKRVIGLPGDRVVVRDGQIRVYNSENPGGLNPDATHQQNGSYTEGDVDVVVPEGSVFVVGDNREPGASSDSRSWGVLPSSDIVGNVVARLYPFNKIDTF